MDTYTLWCFMRAKKQRHRKKVEFLLKKRLTFAQTMLLYKHKQQKSN